MNNRNLQELTTGLVRRMTLIQEGDVRTNNSTFRLCGMMHLDLFKLVRLLDDASVCVSKNKRELLEQAKSVLTTTRTGFIAEDVRNEPLAIEVKNHLDGLIARIEERQVKSPEAVPTEQAADETIKNVKSPLLDFLHFLNEIMPAEPAVQPTAVTESAAIDGRPYMTRTSRASCNIM